MQQDFRRGVCQSMNWKQAWHTNQLVFQQNNIGFSLAINTGLHLHLGNVPLTRRALFTSEIRITFLQYSNKTEITLGKKNPKQLTPASKVDAIPWLITGSNSSLPGLLLVMHGHHSSKTPLLDGPFLHGKLRIAAATAELPASPNHCWEQLHTSESLSWQPQRWQQHQLRAEPPSAQGMASSWWGCPGMVRNQAESRKAQA